MMSLIKLVNVSKSVKNQALLTNVSLTVNAGDIVTLEGINGSGKTLILKAILGLIRTTGDVLINDQKLTVGGKFPIRAGILIENPSIIDNFTAKKNLELLARLLPEVTDQQIDNLLTQFELPINDNKKVRKFSLGMRQKLGIAQAVLGQSPLIILDEPTNALDAESIDKLVTYLHQLQQRGCTFVIASHDRDFVEQVASRRFQVKAGQAHEI
ncbi:ribose abc transporter atpase [Lactiplantibacillus xiangfangensis]|uniref:Ribose abc transporter atpase n=2 Tax=Lactiplantibacillus xiangfangensis TaxID=942150 RepID=A0A0R2MAX4_9LACO|nr:ribose abc transporter atpase [Lactiplantibacillus xiangfangensis]